MRGRLLLAVTAAVAAAVLPAGSAQAAVAWSQCPEADFRAFECGRTTVPVDRAGGSAGTIDLFARRLRAPANPGAVALVPLAGGPGQPATPGAASAAVALASALGQRDLLAFDQRGTGRSGALRCRALRRNLSAVRRAASCAREIGPRRAFFRTEDSVEDLEALRREAGYERLALYGTSYGTKVALAYASRYPERVERLVLDSVVTPEGPDVFKRSSFAAVPRVLGELCGEGRCQGITPDPVADVRRLVARRTIRGSYRTSRGRLRRASMGGSTLFSVMEDGDLNQAWRALLPGAMRAAARGDETPLLRLAVLTLGGGGSRWQGSSVNDALFQTTVCEELAFPWDRRAGAATRIEQGVAALNAIPAGAFAPFDRRSAAGASLLALCAGWPNASPAPSAPPEIRPVRALVLNGDADLRTPSEDARSVGARLGAPVVTVPHVGHSVIGSDPTGCARDRVAAFFRDAAVEPCPAGQPGLFPQSRPPRRLSGVRRARGFPNRIGRTMNAISLTRNDALVHALGLSLDGRRGRFGGLRRGTISVGSRGVTLRGVEFIPGVRVSGTFSSRRRSARLRIGGRAAARGRVTVTATSIRGRFGGRRISARARSSAVEPAPWWPGRERSLRPFPRLVAP